MKNKGFTLIELLAVIVILAIISLIAAPIVLNIIESSRKSASIRSAEIYLDAVSKSLVKEQVNGDYNFEGEYIISSTGIIKNAKEIKVDVVKNKPKPGGYIKLDKNGKVLDARFNINNYTINVNSEEKITINSGDKLYKKSNVSIFSNTPVKSFEIDTDQYILNNYSSNWVILVHGLTGNKEDNPGNLRNKYLEYGFNVLTPQMRYGGTGAENLNYNTGGWLERFDIIECINYIIKIDKNAKIILHGFSQGAATVTMVSGEELPKNVIGIIEDSGYTSWEDAVTYTVVNNKEMVKATFYQLTGQNLNIPDNQLKDTILHFSTEKLKESGVNIKEVSSVEQVKKATVPMLFMHGSKDTVVNPSDATTLYNSAINVSNKKLFIQEGFSHCEATESEEYWQAVKEFINSLNN